MAKVRSVQVGASYAWCGGPDAPSRAHRSPAVYCRDACRKAAYEARRRGRPEAFTVKLVEKVVVESHNLAECTTNAIGSPAGCKRVLQALAALHREGTLGTDLRWLPVHRAAVELAYALGFEPTSRGHRRPQ
jgi:hypothetical protein